MKPHFWIELTHQWSVNFIQSYARWDELSCLSSQASASLVMLEYAIILWILDIKKSLCFESI